MNRLYNFQVESFNHPSYVSILCSIDLHWYLIRAYMEDYSLINDSLATTIMS
jgi:hypothetical protein